MNPIVFDDAGWERLLPFTHTRPVADILCGIFTMRERWEAFVGTDCNILCRPELQGAFPPITGLKNLLLNGRVFCSKEMMHAVNQLDTGQKLCAGNTVIAARPVSDKLGTLDDSLEGLESVPYSQGIEMLELVTDIFSKNERAIVADFKHILTNCEPAMDVPEGVTVSGKEQVYLSHGAKIAAGVIINATSGPVYIADGAEIMEGCLIRGPFALLQGATLKMGAKVYGGTTIGPGCKVGGEVSNVVLFANSNKGHDGFLGNAVIGEWCNLGADTNCSNLKNNYDEVKIWDEAQMKSVKTGLTFCGLLMGDHSKCGINTMFNTGTVVGVSCNIWGGGFPEKFVPSFSWGGPDGMTTYSFTRAADTANRMMARRGKSLTAADTAVLQAVFEKTKRQRDLLHSASTND